jgi:hypothetical protein
MRELRKVHKEKLYNLLLLIIFMALQPFVGPCRFFSFLILHTVGRTPWTGDQPIARLLPTHRIIAYNTDIYTLSAIQTHDPSVRESEDSWCLRPHVHCDRQLYNLHFSLIIFMMIKSKRIRWAGHMVRMRDIRIVFSFNYKTRSQEIISET